MKYQFIYKNTNSFTVEKMCKCFSLSRNAYYHWVYYKKDCIENESLTSLKIKIKEIFHNSKQIYGSARIKKMLEREDLFYSRSYIALLMKQMGLRSVLRRKYVITTDSNHSYKTFENKLDRDFNSMNLGEKWVSDITYIRVNSDWNYLTTIIDLADRKVVGWSLSEDMTTKNTVVKAWNNARSKRAISDKLIFHSDRGVQYASNSIIKMLCFNNKVTQSMSRKGNCWDNAVAESFFKTIKNEWLYRFRYKSYTQLYDSINEYINWYNTKRIHSSLGYLTPLEMEVRIRRKINKVA